MENKIQIKDNVCIGPKYPPFIIAEIGNNHNGSFNLACDLVRIAKSINVNAVKFQKKDIETSFPKKLLDRSYDGPNSYGKTYREHKKALELSDDEIKELFEYCKELDIICFATAFDQKSVKLLEKWDSPIHKVCSFHVTDIELIKTICQTEKPVFLSTGMSSVSEIDKAVEIIHSYGNPFVLSHCVSSYPTKIYDMNLKVIEFLKYRYADSILGYSGHNLGWVESLAVIPFGVSVIEQHFTLDKKLKGPDHNFSLNPDEMMLLVEHAKRVWQALGSREKKILNCEKAIRKKILDE